MGLREYIQIVSSRRTQSITEQSDLTTRFMFELPGCRGKSPLLTSRDAGCTQGLLAGCHHTYTSLLDSLPCPPFPWEALSSHTSSVRRSAWTHLCVSQGTADKHQLPDPTWPKSPHPFPYQRLRQNHRPCPTPDQSQL